MESDPALSFSENFARFRAEAEGIDPESALFLRSPRNVLALLNSIAARLSSRMSLNSLRRPKVLWPTRGSRIFKPLASSFSVSWCVAAPTCDPR